MQPDRVLQDIASRIHAARHGRWRVRLHLTPDDRLLGAWGRGHRLLFLACAFSLRRSPRTPGSVFLAFARSLRISVRRFSCSPSFAVICVANKRIHEYPGNRHRTHMALPNRSEGVRQPCAVQVRVPPWAKKCGNEDSTYSARRSSP